MIDEAGRIVDILKLQHRACVIVFAAPDGTRSVLAGALAHQVALLELLPGT